MSIGTFKISLKRLFKFQLSWKELRKLLNKTKRLCNYVTNMKLSNKLKEWWKRLLFLKNSKKQLEISTILKRFSRLLIELLMFLFQSSLTNKSWLKFPTFLKKSLKKSLLCLKLLKSLSMFIKLLKNKPWE